MKKYAFLDRDGALIYEPTLEDTKKRDVPYQIDSLEKLKILPGVLDGLKKLVEDGYKLVMITNQNGIGTDSFPEEDFWIPQNRMMEIFKENGIEFEKVFICPHFPEDNCNCRKPKIGLVDEFLKSGGIDFANSFMSGDRDTDRQFANNIGVRFIPMTLNGDFSEVMNQI